MEKRWVYCVGLMSGTSLDGLDIAFCKFKEKKNAYLWEILSAETVPYPKELQQSLHHAMSLGAFDLRSLDLALGKWIGDQTNQFIEKQQLKVEFIASHGHTIYHQPSKGITVQIGNANAIHEKTALPVVNNFRELDVLKGGQGAPLVPIGDKLLFGEYQACLNLGGIANISFDEEEGKRVAFDICECNLILNHLSKQKGLPYDEGGHIASKGKVDAGLFQALKSLPFYSKEAPKSLGKEYVDEVLLPLLSKYSLSTEDSMATFVEHICYQISQVTQENKIQNMLVSGGGSWNEFLLQRLKSMSGDKVKVVRESKLTTDFKEALVFAFLGLLRKEHKINVLKTVTGAASDSIAGDIVG